MADFGRWALWRRWLGRKSERYAARFLRHSGFRILAANINELVGELDLLTLDPDRQTIAVVEVRSVTGTDPQTAADTVNLPKQKRLVAATVRYLGRRQLLGQRLRFDVLALAWPPGDALPKILHIRDAFQPTDRFQFFV